VKEANPGVVLKHKQSQDFTTSETLNPLYETSCGWNSEPQNIEYRTAEFRRMVSLRSVFFYKIDRSTQKLTTGRMPSFDIRYSLFDIRFFRVSFSIRPAALLRRVNFSGRRLS
jgi:hypothetical protein